MIYAIRSLVSVWGQEWGCQWSANYWVTVIQKQRPAMPISLMIPPEQRQTESRILSKVR